MTGELAIRRGQVEGFFSVLVPFFEPLVTQYRAVRRLELSVDNAMISMVFNQLEGCDGAQSPAESRASMPHHGPRNEISC